MNTLTRTTLKSSTGKSSIVGATLNIDDCLYTAMKNEDGVFITVNVEENNLDSLSKLEVNIKNVKLSSKKQDCGYKLFSVDHYATKHLNPTPSQHTKQIKVYLAV